MTITRVSRFTVLALVGALVVGACSQTGASSAPASQASQAPTGSGGGGGGDLTIGVTFPVLDQFLQTVADGMEAKADEIGGITLNIVAADEETDTQLGQVENFVSQGVDAIIVIPVDTDATGPMTEAATAANIPLVYVNRRPAEKPDTVPYVGSDSLYAGTVEMQALADLAGDEGNVVILIGDPANEAAVLRTKGCKDVAAERGMTVTKEQSGNWRRVEGLEIMENWIQSGDPFKVVCANNDEMALGAIEALKNADMLDDVLVGGVDATADALAAMQAGDLEVTVFQDAAGQGGGGVEAAVKLANGEAAADVDVPYVLVTPDNIDDYL